MRLSLSRGLVLVAAAGGGFIAAFALGWTTASGSGLDPSGAAPVVEPPALKVARLTPAGRLPQLAATLSALTVSPASVTGGSPSLGRVTLAGTAPAGGAVVSLVSSDARAATAPRSVRIRGGTSSATFTVKTSGVRGTTEVRISGVYGRTTLTARLTVAATPPQSTGPAPRRPSPSIGPTTPNKATTTADEGAIYGGS